jgi:DeoR family transcriptional regulator, glycerol-3-phosphate regulon repressor
MRHSKRQSELLRLVRERGTITIHDLATLLAVSLETIRRDVEPLTTAGLLIKMHGAVSLPAEMVEAPIRTRTKQNYSEKQAVANHMAARIADGDTVMMDTGTTTSLLARALLQRSNLTIITNSAEIVGVMAGHNGNSVFLAGGQIQVTNLAAVGQTAIDFVSRFKVQHAIITIGGVDARVGLTDFTIAEAEFARAVLACGAERIVVTDSTKFDKAALVKVCDLDGIDRIVTNAPPSPELAGALRRAKVIVDFAAPAIEPRPVTRALESA